jgi:hypothetical protein
MRPAIRAPFGFVVRAWLTLEGRTPVCRLAAHAGALAQIAAGHRAGGIQADKGPAMPAGLAGRGPGREMRGRHVASVRGLWLAR